MNTENVIVSVILPVYNAEKYLARCIESVMNQKGCQIELVIVNDGSKDGSDAVIKSFNDPRIKYIQKSNGGVSSARNIALDQATGDYITFIDADDYIESDYCGKMLQNIVENEADICTCRAIDHHLKNDNDIRYMPESDKLLFLDSDSYSFFDDSLQKAVCCTLIKKSLIGDIRFRDDIFVAEDSLFLAECIHKAGKIVVMYKNLYHYMIFDESTSHGAYDERKKTEFAAWRQIAEINKDKEWVYATCRARYADRCLKVIRRYHFKMGVDKQFYREIKREYRKNVKYIFKVNHRNYSLSKFVMNCAYAVFAVVPPIYPVYYYLRYKEKA